jgi:ATPase, P-type (transporting), HAD superfamily, subfamily IC
MLYYNQSVEELFERFHTSERGLSSSDVKKQREKYGLNLIKIKTTPLWKKLLEPFVDVFMIVLIIASILSLVKGNTLDASIIGSIILINAVIDYVQQFSTERILRTLKKKSAQKVRIVRNGSESEVDSSELVPGDIIMLAEGDKIPADSRVVHASNVRVDESLLTGESVPISKHANKLNGDKEIYEQTNLLFAGSFIISGTVKTLVIRTGNETEYGRIADLASDTDTLSPVQIKITKLVAKIAIAVGIMSVIVFILSMIRGMGLFDSLEFVMAMAVSAVPEGLPVAISIILALGMRRMAKKKALVADMHAIETVGVITTIATDKTGTLTENKLSVREVWKMSGSKENLNRNIALAINNPRDSKDPLDVAMLEYIQKEGEQLLETTPVKSLPFDQDLAVSGNLWHEGKKISLVIKGAPERLIDKSSLTENEKEECLSEVQRLAGSGYRVIGLARTMLGEDINSMAKVPKRHRFHFIGLVAVADTLRKSSKAAITEARRAGVTVRMITGDHFETAYSIGKELGIASNRGQVLDCRKLELLQDSELKHVVEHTRVFARVTPEAKFKILSILKEYEIAAMTGDGVNDVPALANAHIGIAMGSGSEIARNAGGIVLLDDNFGSIVSAMREGRVIIANIRRMLAYLLATNAGEALTMIGALLIGSSVPLLPVQILWVNLVTDSMLVIPLGLEEAESNVMRKKPESPDSPILDRNAIVRMVIVAITIAAITLTVYTYYTGKLGEAMAGSLAFMALVVTQLACACNARSNYQSFFVRMRTHNVKFYVGMIVAIFLQCLVFFGPLHDILHVVDVPLDSLAIVCVWSFVIPLAVVELHKLSVFVSNNSSK